MFFQLFQSQLNCICNAFTSKRQPTVSGCRKGGQINTFCGHLSKTGFNCIGFNALLHHPPPPVRYWTGYSVANPAALERRGQGTRHTRIWQLFIPQLNCICNAFSPSKQPNKQVSGCRKGGQMNTFCGHLSMIGFNWVHCSPFTTRRHCWLLNRTFSSRSRGFVKEQQETRNTQAGAFGSHLCMAILYRTGRFLAMAPLPSPQLLDWLLHNQISLIP